jgi:serine/threonine-protein phosphatase 2B catalytic subunit
MDVFSWSVPFLAEKVTSLLLNIVQKGGDDDDEPEVDINTVLSHGDKTKVIKRKITTMARISRMYTTLREESENLLKIKNISPDGKLPRGLLLAGKPAIKNGKYILN